MQFDICRNTGRSRAAAPYLLVVQSDWFDRSNRRVVVPLIAAKPPASIHDPVAMPAVVVGDTTVYLDVLGILNIAVEQLGDVVASAREDRDAIVRALDWLIHTGPSAQP